jgi:hypothetical protein
MRARAAYPCHPGVRARAHVRGPRSAPGLAAGLVAAAFALAPAAHAGSRFAFVPAAVETTRAYEYASMSAELCLMELDERGIEFEEVEGFRKIATPVRLLGPLHGVAFKQSYFPPPEGDTPGTVLDCPLALALDDLASVAAGLDVVEVRFLSMYRPGPAHHGSRHPSGRAIDIASVLLADGAEYSVAQHFFGRTGHETCGAGANEPRIDHPGAWLWRDLVCEVDGLRAFNLMLTPNHDWGHRDHLHLEVRSGVRWFLTQ